MAVTDRYTNYQKEKKLPALSIRRKSGRSMMSLWRDKLRKTHGNSCRYVPRWLFKTCDECVYSQYRSRTGKCGQASRPASWYRKAVAGNERTRSLCGSSPAVTGRIPVRSGFLSQEKGQEGLSYTELAEALRGRDPLQSEEDRINAERRLRAAESINAVGSVLANLVNVVRTRRGNPSMNLSGAGREGQARIDRIRQYRDNLSRQNYQDYIGAIARDRAEQARIELNQAKQKQFYDKLDHDAAQKELERQFKIDYSLLSQGQKEKLESIKDKHRRGQISLSKALELKIELQLNQEKNNS